MPEEVAFEQVRRQRTRIDDDEGGAGTVAVLMDGPCDQLFSGPAFTLNENGAPRGG